MIGRPTRIGQIRDLLLELVGGEEVELVEDVLVDEVEAPLVELVGVLLGEARVGPAEFVGLLLH